MTAADGPSTVAAPGSGLPAGGIATIAPAKVNATLLVGPVRPEDGRHELTSVMQSLDLHDDVALVPGAPGAAADTVDCPGVEGDNLALRALRAFRAATGWDPGPLTVRIVKRIPVAAGMAGGSADASAVLRLCAHASGHGDERLLASLAAELGADVPHGLQPGLALAAGAGEQLERIPGVLPGALVVVRAALGLSTPSVFRRADELSPPRTAADLAAARERVAAALRAPDGPSLPPALAQNDLGRAAVDLAPVVGEHVAALAAAGALPAMVCGSGPTTVGWFPAPPAADAAAARLRAGGLDALVAVPSAGAPVTTIPPA